MKIIIIGASRGIGRETVRAALKKGHTVTAFARHPEQLDIKHPNLHLQAGDALDLSTLKAAIAGHDAVICTLGLSTRQAIGPPFSKPDYLLSIGTGNILSAMKAKGIRRFVCVTAIGVGDSRKQCSLLTRLILRFGLGWLFRQKYQQEQLIMASDTDWTILRPTALTNGRAKGVMENYSKQVGILTHISRADVAAVAVKILNKPTSYHQALTLTYPPRFGDSIRWIGSHLS